MQRLFSAHDKQWRHNRDAAQREPNTWYHIVTKEFVQGWEECPLEHIDIVLWHQCNIILRTFWLVFWSGTRLSRQNCRWVPRRMQMFFCGWTLNGFTAMEPWVAHYIPTCLLLHLFCRENDTPTQNPWICMFFRIFDGSLQPDATRRHDWPSLHQSCRVSTQAVTRVLQIIIQSTLNGGSNWPNSPVCFCVGLPLKPCGSRSRIWFWILVCWTIDTIH